MEGTVRRHDPQQLQRLGASCDWTRERFTMDEGLSRRVPKVFVQLYKEGLIYRDKRLVNWDPHFETAISDLEVENREVKGHFWHFKYPLENGETYTVPDRARRSRQVPPSGKSATTSRSPPRARRRCWATARWPCIPSDKRYAPIVGKQVLLPLADRYIPIITDEYPDPELRLGRGEDHRRARLQRLQGRPSATTFRSTS